MKPMYLFPNRFLDFALGPESRLGYCAWCQGWLGQDVLAANNLDDLLAENELQRHIWKTDVVGELLAASPLIRVLLGRSSPLSREMLRNLRHGDTIPQLDTLLTLCFWLSTSPLRFFTEDIDPISIEYQDACGREEQDSVLRTRRSQVELEQLRVELEKLVDDPTEPPLSLSAVARLLKCHYPFLLNRFPDQSRAISSRFRSYARTRSMQRRAQLVESVLRIVPALHAEGIYPSPKVVAERSGQARIMQYTEVKAAYRQALDDLHLE